MSNDQSTSSNADEEQNEPGKDPSQKTAPRVTTTTSILGEQIPVLGKITIGNFPLVVPALVMGLLTFVFGFMEMWIVTLFFLAMTILCTIAAGIAVTATAWHSTPLQRTRDWFAYLLLKRTMPWSYHDSIAREVHGIEEIYERNGVATIETSDGRFVRAVRAKGVNTNGLTAREQNEMVSHISRGVDEEAGNIPVNFYSTTTEFDTEGVMGHYLDAADQPRMYEAPLRHIQEMFISVYEWFEDVDQPTYLSKDWQHYVFTEISVDEVSTAGDSDGVKGILWPPEVREISIADRREMLKQLDNREEIIRSDVIESVQGGEASSVGAAEMIALLQSYWGDDLAAPTDARIGEGDGGDGDAPLMVRKTDEIEMPSHVSELADVDETAAEESAGSDDSWPRPVRPVRVLLERLPYVGPDPEVDEGDVAGLGAGTRDAIAPDHFRTTRNQTSVGNEYAKTFWISQWPQDVDSLFLKQLTSMRGADIQIKIYNDPLDKQTITDALRYDVRDLIIEESETGDQLSAMELGDDQQTYVSLYKLFRDTSTQPREINGYITVRVTDQTALEFADEHSEDVNLSVLKHRVLRDLASDVRGVAEKKCGLTLTEVRERRKECFIAGSPVGPDEYSQTAEGDSKAKKVFGSFASQGVGGELSSNKVTLGAGGAVGAMMPWCTSKVMDDDAPLWGRNMTNGTPMLVDLFSRGSSGHALTVGKTRDGKTYSVSNVAEDWYNMGDDKTLIVCDTQRGFEGLTEACDGEHIVVDGSQEINPLAVEPPRETNRHAGMSSVLQQKVEEVSEFFRSALVAQGVEDADEYTSTLEEIAIRAYKDAGIYMGDPASLSNPSPGISDYLQAGSDLLHEAKESSVSGHEAEYGKKEERLGELLNYLSGFRKGGKYHDLLGASDTLDDANVEPTEQAAREAVTATDGGSDQPYSPGMGIGLDDPDTDMVYIDLQNYRRHDDVDKSVMLQLLLGQVTQTVRKSEGEVVFIVDEAHVLYHSQEMVRQLEKFSREWARHDAALWSVTQHPNEILGFEGIDGAEVIKDQSSIIQVFRLPGVEPETLSRLGVPPSLHSTVTSELVAGKEGKGYSECLLSLYDERGWFKTKVETAPYKHDLLTHSPEDHGPLDEYMTRRQHERSDSDGGVA